MKYSSVQSTDLPDEILMQARNQKFWRGGSDFLFHFNATFLFIANVFEFILVYISLFVNIYLQKENRKNYIKNFFGGGGSIPTIPLWIRH
jgi:hypothetical protein